MQRREQQRMNQSTSTRTNQSGAFSGNSYNAGAGGYALVARQESYPLERESRYVPSISHGARLLIAYFPLDQNPPLLLPNRISRGQG